MANLTVVVSEAVLLKARQRALEQHTSVNALLRGFLETYVGERNRAASLRELVRRASEAGGRSKGRWTRDQLHER
jgi:hypothetical protein